MYFTEERLREAVEEARELIREYTDCYSDLKVPSDDGNENDVILSVEHYEKMVSEHKLSDYSMVWSESLFEPYNSFYITEIADNTILPRRICTGAVRKRAGKAVHYYCDGEPEYTAYYGKNDSVVREEFFVRRDDVRIGMLFPSGGGDMSRITIEHFDEDNKPVNFLWMYVNSMLGGACGHYEYEDDRIVSAEYIMRLYLDRDVIAYEHDDGLTVPGGLQRYTFVYPENGGLVTECIKEEYTSRRCESTKMKVPATIVRHLDEYGIKWFTK